MNPSILLLFYDRRWLKLRPRRYFLPSKVGKPYYVRHRSAADISSTSHQTLPTRSDQRLTPDVPIGNHHFTRFVKSSVTSLEINPSMSLASFLSSLHGLPKVICIEVFREFWINVDNMDITLFGITNYCFVVITSFILF